MPTPRLSAFTPRYNTTVRARPRVVTGDSSMSYRNPMNNGTRKNKPYTVSFNSQKEVFPLADTGNNAKNAQNAENQTNARKSIEVSNTTYRPEVLSQNNALQWGNIQSKHNSYSNAMRNIYSRGHLSSKSKAALERAAAFMYEPTKDERHYIPKFNTTPTGRLPLRSAFSAAASRSLIPTRSSRVKRIQTRLRPRPAPINRKGRRTRRR